MNNPPLNDNALVKNQEGTVELEAHFYADLFPYLSDEELEDLAADIQENGQREPIVLYRGEILDGRNRYRACLKRGIEPVFKQFQGDDDDALRAVLSWNLQRRHLSSSQRAVIALDVLLVFEALAEQRRRRNGEAQAANLRQFQGSHRDQQIFADPGDPNPQARDQAAAAVGTNRQYVSDAKRIAEQSPELIEKIRQGELTLPKAKALSALPAETRAEVLEKVQAAPSDKQEAVLQRELRQAQGEDRRQQRIEKINQIAQGNTDLQSVVEALAAPERFPVIYADPPWRYEHTKTDSRKVENHYPTMGLDEICALPVADIATPDAILFLWATSPKLAESLAVVTAWGFTYRTCATWVKTDCAFGMGYYFRQQHELLLVATRGQIPAPQPADRVSSVIEAKPTEHSEKPARVAEIIEAMYGDLPKLELFCRSPRQGWFAWGNQAGGVA